MTSFGFIIVRNVQSKVSNEYWKECVRCIRLLYSEPIIVFDSGSCAEFLDSYTALNLQIVNAEKTNKAVFGAYTYFLENHPFDTAVIIHDSVFIRRFIKFHEVRTVKFIWHFTHTWNNPTTETKLLSYLHTNERVRQVYENQAKWVGSLGAMSVITHAFLTQLQTAHNFLALQDGIQEWADWVAFERILGVLCCIEDASLVESPSLLGDVHKYSVRFGFPYDHYIKKLYSPKASIVKVYSTRK
jgi:hypothetical protein